ncbi:V-set domain containing T-cell activation inhibitor 1-like [Hyperolius riggenbachi]|uniref:V-set domain containing T-cell activation inhibitor 1-like n=1 Tax=Hyperolius riggenbachi TaxID=752182 RepID=UPI0035A26C29
MNNFITATGKTWITLSLLLFCANIQDVVASDEVRVTATLYSTLRLPCSFLFIIGEEGLSAAWELVDKDGRRLLVHKFTKGQDDFTNQDLQFTERTELSKQFSEGNLDLTLREVTYNDEGRYFCRATNNKGHGDKEVELSINELNANDAMVTVTHVEGKKHLKCIETGMFRNPWVRWFDDQGKDLSELGTRKITEVKDGKKKVESVLDYDVEINKHYFCQIREGRLRRTARAVISAGDPVSVPVVRLPE